MTSKILTQARLKEVIHYAPDTGIFTWCVSRGTCKAGALSGTINHDGYLRVKVDKRSYMAHRLASLYITGGFPQHDTDHINHIKNDNRWCNLRAVTRRENMHNSPQQSNNTSGVTGVHWCKAKKKWQVFIKAKGRNLHGGFFIDKQEAINKRKALEVQHNYHPNHGEML